jgi:glycosyltransferase involved in cell wall biosynthesis
VGNLDRAIGYGAMNHGFTTELRRQGVELTPHEVVDGRVDPVIVFGAPPNHVRKYWQGQRTINFTMWETTVIPAAFRCTLDVFDTILVPSEQNAQMFGEYHPDVRYVPLGVDTDVWRPTPRKGGTFTFLSMSNSARKGNDLLPKAFERVFGDGGNRVQMVILDPRRRLQPQPGVILVNSMVSEDELLAHYGAAHCYVSASRGEGFGLQPLQAMAQGCPTILSDAHGQHQFAHLGVPVPCGFSPSYGFVHGEAGDWWEPDFDALCAAMADVHDNYADHLQRAEANAAVVRDEWNWTLATEKLLAELGDLTGEMIPAGRMIDPSEYERRFVLRVSKHTPCHIGGVNFDFWPGTDYKETADVKRVIYDAGLLDESCIDPREPGFSNAELAAIRAGAEGVLV